MRLRLSVGILPLIVVSLGCCWNSAITAAAANPVPIITQPLVPAAVNPGSSGFTLTVRGVNFVTGSVVHWNGSPRATTVVSSSEVTAAISAADITRASTAIVTVTSPAPGGGTSNPEFLQVSDPTSLVVYNTSSVSAGVTSPVTAMQTVVADFNGDAKLDMATQNSDGTVSVLLGNGDGTFQPAAVYNTGCRRGIGFFYFGGIAVGDFNGDGIVDIAAFCSFSDPFGGFGGLDFLFTLLPGNGNGTFGALIAYTVPNFGVPVGNNLAAVDVNGDGILDLVGNCDNFICVSFNKGNFTFPGTFGVLSFVYGHIQSFALGDFNRDGKLDVAITYTDSVNEYLALALGTGDLNVFGPFKTLVTTPKATFGSVAAADFNGDGILDLVYYHETCATTGVCSGTLEEHNGVGNGTFRAANTTTGLAGGIGLPVVADLNADGKLDVAILNSVLLGRGDGTFDKNADLLPQNAANAGDFDGDGKLDLISPNQTDIFVLTEIPADFSLSATPSSVSVAAGGTVTYAVQVQPENGFLGEVMLSVSGLPAGTTASFTRESVASGQSSNLKIITANATKAGTYTLTITGTSGELKHGTSVALIVTP